MKCPEREQLFHLAQGLAAKEAEDLRAHAAACERCRAVLEEYGRLDAVLAEWQAAEPSPWLEARVRAAVESELIRRPRTLFGLRLAWLAPVVALAILIGAVLLVVREPKFPLRPVRPPEIVEKAGEPAPAGPVGEPTHEPAIVTVTREDEDLAAFDDLDLFANFEILSELRREGNGRAN